MRPNPFPVTQSMRRFAFGVSRGALRAPLKQIRRLPTLEAVSQDGSLATRLGACEPRVVDAGPYGRRTVRVYFCAPGVEDVAKNSKAIATPDTGSIFVYLTPSDLRDASFEDQIERAVLHELVHLFDPKARREDLAHLRGSDDANFALTTVRGGALTDIRMTAAAPYGKEAFGEHAAALAGMTPRTRGRILRRLERAELDAYHADPAEVDAYMTQAIWDLVKELDNVEPRHLARAKQHLIDEARTIARHMARGRGHYVERSDLLRRWSKAGPGVWRRFVRGLVRAIEGYRRPRWARARVALERGRS